MGAINEVYYEELDPRVCTVGKAGEYYFLSNLIGVHPGLDEEFMKYDTAQIELRNKVIGYAIEEGKIDRHPDMSSTIFGVSSRKNKAILVVNF